MDETTCISGDTVENQSQQKLMDDSTSDDTVENQSQKKLMGDTTSDDTVENQSQKKLPYTCTICGKSFYAPFHLKTHLRSHTGEKPFSCQICGKAFAQKSSCTSHMKTHAGIKPYTCTTCGKSFTRNGHLLAHYRSHTGEKPHKCDFCGRTFNLRTTLTRHMKIHSEDKPFKCSFCSYAFREKYDLKIHLSNHSGDKPYKCPICNLGLARNTHLKKHMQRHLEKNCAVLNRGVMVKSELDGRFVAKKSTLSLITEEDSKVASDEEPMSASACGNLAPVDVFRNKSVEEKCNDSGALSPDDEAYLDQLSPDVKIKIEPGYEDEQEVSSDVRHLEKVDSSSDWNYRYTNVKQAAKFQSANVSEKQFAQKLQSAKTADANNTTINVANVQRPIDTVVSKLLKNRQTAGITGEKKVEGSQQSSVKRKKSTPSKRKKKRNCGLGSELQSHSKIEGANIHVVGTNLSHVKMVTDDHAEVDENSFPHTDGNTEESKTKEVKKDLTTEGENCISEDDKTITKEIIESEVMRKEEYMKWERMTEDEEWTSDKDDKINTNEVNIKTERRSEDEECLSEEDSVEGKYVEIKGNAMFLKVNFDNAGL